MRRNQFTVDAESVQGNPGSEITFRNLTLGTVDRYREDDAYGDIALVREHLIGWKGFVDVAGKEIPSPEDEPGVEAKLYLSEITQLARLLFQGPDGEHAKN